MTASPLVVEKEKGVFSRYPKNNLSQTEEEHACARRYTKVGGNGRIIWAGSVEQSATGKSTRDDYGVGRRNWQRFWRLGVMSAARSVGGYRKGSD
jgi:hypothetical protein